VTLFIVGGEHVLIDFSDVIVRSLSAPSVQSCSSA
jgi:hypothetical protein